MSEKYAVRCFRVKHKLGVAHALGLCGLMNLWISSAREIVGRRVFALFMPLRWT